MLARSLVGLIPATQKIIMPKRIRPYTDENVVRSVQELKQISDSSKARQFLEEIKRHVDPVLKVSCNEHLLERLASERRRREDCTSSAFSKYVVVRKQTWVPI